jgi:hypothetical protein
MNNKLIADIERNRKRNYLLGNIVPELEILVKNGSAFTKEESIEVLNKIRDRLVLLQSELKESYVTARKMRKELNECCTHEVLIKRSNYYECAICGECFGLENIDFNTFLIDSLEEGVHLYYITSCVISEIAINDEAGFKQLVETAKKSLAN